MSEPIKTFNVSVMLLIEDDDNDIIITKRKLLKSTLKITDLLVAKDLAEGKAMVASRKVDVVLLDLNLPNSQGLATYTSLRSEYDGIIIILTSIDNELLGVEAIRQGADDYLVKNQLTEARISQSVRYSVERREAHQRTAQLKADIKTLQKIIKA